MPGNRNLINLYLGILLLVREKATTHGKQMALRNANPTVLPILKLVKFDRLFETS